MKNERRESYENRLLREKCFKLPEVGETPLLECIDKDFYYYNIYSKCDFTFLYKIDRQFCGRSVLPGSVGNRKLMSRKQKMPMREFLYRFGKGGELPGLSGRTALAGWLCLPEMRAQTRLPPVQRSVPMYPPPPSDLIHSWDGSAS